MGFKEQASKDIDDVFFNRGEFAEEAVIDGRPVPVMLDDDALNGKSDIHALGLAEGERLMFVKQKDMSRLPKPGDQMSVNGKTWYVRHAVSNAGVYEIRIGRDQVYG